MLARTDLWPALRRHARTLLDLTLPAMCPACGVRLAATDQNICQECWEHIQEVEGPLCPRCGLGEAGDREICPGCLKTEVFTDVSRQAAVYREPLETVITQLKYNEVAELAGPAARLLARILARDFSGEAWDLACPVPLHRVRERERGYNQSALIAQRVAAMFGWPFDAHAVRRARWTQSQTRLSRKARLRNVENAFVCPEPALIEGKRVLLIDDVYTTGSTLNETARALKRAGAAEVFGLVVARAEM